MENFNNSVPVAQKSSHKRLFILLAVFVVLFGGIMTLGYLHPQSHEAQVSQVGGMPADSIVIPDNQLKAMQDTYAIDMTGSVKIPGGVAVPRKNISLKGGIDTCMTTSNLDIKVACANKYSFEKKDPTLCKTILSGVQNAAELQNSCLYNYFDTYPDVQICYSMNKSTTDSNVSYYPDSCFQTMAFSSKDQKMCSFIVSDSKKSLCEEATK